MKFPLLCLSLLSIVLVGCSERSVDDEGVSTNLNGAQQVPESSQIEADCHQSLLSALPSTAPLAGKATVHSICNPYSATRVWELPESIVEVSITDLKAVTANNAAEKLLQDSLTMRLQLAKESAKNLEETREFYNKTPEALAAIGGDAYLPYVFSVGDTDKGGVAVEKLHGSTNLEISYLGRYLIVVERSDRDTIRTNQAAEVAFKPIVDAINLQHL